MKWQRMIINSAALRRIGYIYIPAVLTVYLCMYLLAWGTSKPSAALNLMLDMKGKLPVVYHDTYNIAFWGAEELHPFDTKKYRSVFQALVADPGMRADRAIVAAPPSQEILLQAHDADYLATLETSWHLARITELGFCAFFLAA